MSEFSIDGIDKTILRALMKDARTPILEIALLFIKD
jgi:DNA-binding Lrp family transcriptional regulator